MTAEGIDGGHRRWTLIPSVELDEIIVQSLTSLADELSQDHWRGRREREVVSLFCFGHLLRHCAVGSVLYDPAQISIEVAVPQIRGQARLTKRATSKAQVCKDIVLWPRPRMVAWDDARKATVHPMSVVEWKHNERIVSDYDVKWLRQFSSENRTFALAMPFVLTAPPKGSRCHARESLSVRARSAGFTSTEAVARQPASNGEAPGVRPRGRNQKPKAGRDLGREVRDGGWEVGDSW